MKSSIHFCLKLKDAHIAYNKENNSKITFCKFLRILQYSRKDISQIIDIMNNVTYNKK